jgi:hypothetical protein
MTVRSESTAPPGGVSIGKIIGLLALLALGNLAGWIIGQIGWTLDFRAFFIIVIAAALFVAFIAGRRVWEPLFFFWILTFALGYRTFHVTSNLSIHPSEVIMWLLFVSLLGTAMVRHKIPHGILPILGWFFVAIYPLGLVRAFQNGIPPDVQLADLLPMLVLVPIFAFTREMVTAESSPRIWRTIGGLLTVVAFYISFLGVLEYYFPSVIAPFHGFFSESLESISEEGFVRASFSFWGSPVVSNILVLILPMLFVQFYWWKRVEARLFLLGTVLVTFLAIYISGYRSVWFLSIGEIFLYFLLRRSGKWLGLVTGALAVVAVTAPVVAQDRVLALLQEGFMSDSSAVKRLQRAVKALMMIRQSPLTGSGWGSTGWIHSDLLQIGAQLGVIALLVFVVWYIVTVTHIFGVYRSAKEPWIWEESIGLLTVLAGFIVVLALQAVIVLSQLIIPVWLLFALADILPRIAKNWKAENHMLQAENSLTSP